MESSFCRHEKNGDCVLLKNKCAPGQKGCVIVKAGYKVAEFKSKYKKDNNIRR